MNWLEIIGSGAIWIGATLVVCFISMLIGSQFGKDKELAGLVYVIYPPIIIIVLSAIIGVFVLGRVSA